MTLSNSDNSRREISLQTELNVCGKSYFNDLCRLHVTVHAIRPVKYVYLSLISQNDDTSTQTRQKLIFNLFGKICS